jgi:hypothetical protein
MASCTATLAIDGCSPRAGRRDAGRGRLPASRLGCARAGDGVDYRSFIAVCDRAGPERGVDWIGGSAIVVRDGFPTAGPAHADEVVALVAGCALPETRDKQIGEHNNALADRRPELYADVALAD